MTKKMFYEVYPLEYYTKEKIEKLTDWEIISLINLLNTELWNMRRPSTIKSIKLINYYQEKLNLINKIFKDLYNNLFDRTYQFTDDDIISIHVEFNNNYKVINNLINNSMKGVRIIC